MRDLNGSIQIILSVLTLTLTLTLRDFTLTLKDTFFTTITNCNKP